MEQHTDEATTDEATADGVTTAGAGSGAGAAAWTTGAVGAFTMLSIHTVLSRKIVPDFWLLIRTPFGSLSLRIWP